MPVAAMFSVGEKGSLISASYSSRPSSTTTVKKHNTLEGYCAIFHEHSLVALRDIPICYLLSALLTDKTGKTACWWTLWSKRFLSFLQLMSINYFSSRCYAAYLKLKLLQLNWNEIFNIFFVSHDFDWWNLTASWYSLKSVELDFFQHSLALCFLGFKHMF